MMPLSGTDESILRRSRTAAEACGRFAADPVVWPGCVYAWLCTSAVEVSRAWQRLLGRRPDWGIGPPRSTGVRKGSSCGTIKATLVRGNVLR